MVAEHSVPVRGAARLAAAAEPDPADRATTREPPHDDPPLHVIATPRGLASNTGRVSTALLEDPDDHYDDLRVRTLDLFKADLPSVAGRNIESKYKLIRQVLDDSAKDGGGVKEAIEQFLATDVYLLTVPMWNFGVPYALKYYIDAIVQPSTARPCRCSSTRQVRVASSSASSGCRCCS